MNIALPALSVAELAWRIALRYDAGDWIALVVPSAAAVAPVAQELEEELRGLNIPIAQAHPVDAEALICAAEQQPTQVLLLSGVEDLPEAEWRHLDLRRDELQRGACVLVVLLEPTLRRLLTLAPNLASWVSGSLWRLSSLGDRLPPEEAARRLVALQQQFAMTNADVLRLATEQRLPRDPAFGEWLILLDRGDLL